MGGAGTWGRYYLHAFAAHPDCEVVALVDRARQRRQVFAARYGIEATYDTVDELLVREVPDIVSAILPTAYTYDAVIACAEAGVRVVSCEKPIAAELARADAHARIDLAMRIEEHQELATFAFHLIFKKQKFRMMIFG